MTPLPIAAPPGPLRAPTGGAVLLVVVQAAAAALLTIPGLALAVAGADVVRWFGMRTPDGTWQDAAVGTGLVAGGAGALLVLGGAAAITALVARATGLRGSRWVPIGALASCLVAGVAVAIGLLAS